MKRFAILVALLLDFTFPAYAQQDPDDPGIQDSIILSEFTVIVHSDTIVTMPVYAVTDDSVGFYNIPLRLMAPMGGAILVSPSQYFSPIAEWDEHYDTVLTSQGYIRQIGFSDLGDDNNPALFTNSHRVHIWDIQIAISGDAHSGLCVIDTVWDDRNGTTVLGLTDGVSEIVPGFKRGIFYIGPWGVGDEEIKPITFSLSQNYPNPFNPSTEIEFSIPRSGPVSLVIYDIQGREVRQLLDGYFDAGSHSVIWNGLDNDNKPVSSGIYFYRLISGDRQQTNRMTLLR
jgi:hypothetical protein